MKKFPFQILFLNKLFKIFALLINITVELTIKLIKIMPNKNKSYNIIYILMFEPSSEIDQYRVNIYNNRNSQTLNKSFTEKDPGLQPWQFQSNSKQASQINKKKQIKVEKLPDVQKFLLSVKNINHSPNQKKQKQQIINQGMTLNLMKMNEFNKSRQFESVDNNSLNKKKNQSLTKCTPNSVEYQKTPKKQQSIKETTTSISKKNITLDNFFEKRFSCQDSTEQQTARKKYKSNLQKILKLKSKAKKNKLTFSQRLKNPELVKNENKFDLKKIYQQRKVTINPIINYPYQKYSYLNFSPHLLNQNKPKREPIRNFFMINHKFQKQKLKEREQKSKFQNFDYKKLLTVALGYHDLKFSQLNNANSTSSKSKPKPKINQSLYIK